ncbi:dispanin subfamily A member 2b-like [Rhinoderma darwinii]|uniref:dispanin subfamily A member 2b-like n=1 Tax=Rhinoderma darwinii TaxID=43563 RepID=UPI003F663855
METKVEEPLSKSSLHCVANEEDESLKVEMIPLKDTTIQVEPTMMTITSEHPGKDHIIWSILNTFYMNFCCLGFIALIFSVKSRDQKLVRNQNRARYYGATARSLNIAASVLTILWFLITATILYFNLLHLWSTITGWFGK